MKRPLAALAIIAIVLLPMPSMGYEFPAESYTDDNMHVDVKLVTDMPWSAPCTGHINLTVQVQLANMSNIPILIVKIHAIVFKKDSDSYFILAAKEESGNPLASGVGSVNYTLRTELTLSTGGAECYFAVAVLGVYINGNNAATFHSLSPNDFLGPVIIPVSMSSPIVMAGILLIVLFTAIIIVGGRHAMSSHRRTRRRLLEE